APGLRLRHRDLRRRHPVRYLQHRDRQKEGLTPLPTVGTGALRAAHSNTPRGVPGVSVRHAPKHRPLWRDHGRVDVLVEPASYVEAGVQRRPARTAGLRVTGHVRAVVVAGGVGRPDGVALVGPDRPDHVALRGHGDVITEE